MATTVPRGRTSVYSVSTHVRYGQVLGALTLSCLLEWFLVNCDQDNSVGSKTILRCSLDIANDILACQKVNKMLCTKLCGHSLLLVAPINGNDLKTHRLGVLDSQRSETTSSTNNCYCLAWSRSRLFQSLIDRDTGAENRCNCL